MPTPFYHLSLAKELLGQATLTPWVRELISAQQPAFYFGKTAPDVQVVSGQTRAETHFYQIPLDRPDPAWQRMLELYPELQPERGLSDEHAAFLAGYLCHLQADQRWLVDIFEPNFGPDGRWGTFSDRLYIHNVLRSYLDLQIVPDLPGRIGQLLQAVDLAEWLPFVDDADLMIWQEFLTRQLQPGARIETVEVFASRQGISTEAYYELIQSEEEMEAKVFSILPRSLLETYRQAVLADNIELINTYLELQGTQRGSIRRVDSQ